MEKLVFVARIVVIGATGFLVLGMICFAVGGRFNSTSSIPLGLYWITDAPVTKDAYVIFCPPQSSLFHTAITRCLVDDKPVLKGEATVLAPSRKFD